MFVALFVATIVVVIMIHEYGHFVTARWFGMKAEKFFLGFGPTLWSTRRGETEYGVKAIPAGGFVKIVGMTPWEPVDAADDGRYFYQQPAWQRAIVLVAGSVTHFLVAAVLLFGGLAFVGLPVATNGVSQVTDDSPAAAAGLEAGDEIAAVNGRDTADFDEVRQAIEPLAGQTVSITVQREGQRATLETVLDTPHPDGSERGFLGVAPQARNQALGIGEGFVGTFSGDFSVFRLTGVTVQSLGQLFSLDSLGDFFSSVGDENPRDPETITSLVGVGQVVNELGTQGDVLAVLVVLAQLNVVLGILNMLPLPPLDGGHLAVLAVEESVNAVRRRGGAEGKKWRLNPSVITPIALLVIMFFVTLTFAAIYVDITKPASELFQ